MESAGARVLFSLFSSSLFIDLLLSRNEKLVVCIDLGGLLLQNLSISPYTHNNWIVLFSSLSPVQLSWVHSLHLNNWKHLLLLLGTRLCSFFINQSDSQAVSRRKSPETHNLIFNWFLVRVLSVVNSTLIGLVHCEHVKLIPRETLFELIISSLSSCR